MVKIGIIGATGYTGGELIRILAGHPEAEITAITSRSNDGKKLEEIYPNFTGWDGPTFSGSDSPDAVAGCDVVFLAVPHGVAMNLAPALLERGQKVIDLGSDFRFRDYRTFETYYKHQHCQPELTKAASYGLPELYRKEIRNAQVVGNPGCYPTSIILGCYPFIKAGVIDSSLIIADSKSGVSGAGRKAELGYIYPELFGNFKAYGVPLHRHTPEIEQELSFLGGRETKVSFTPHLLPIARGILSTLHLTLTKLITTSEAEAIIMDTYKGEPFVKLIKAPGLPDIKGVVGTNCCHLGVRVDERTNQLIVISVIDNMVKGASGQAVQNMNLMCDLPETMGLVQWPVYP
ncbi:MAG TPA: N-acetyl-gamma-glutamyl-phosphate reductase [Bacillota bacterium]|jgi:N-acetyl-gamma-glutamyl-phosphate reductase|nr:N-acetyl-gamma-glutamyl-phosphate reductase [Bacillota bacterium]HOL09136.1 N-acetyl-gamma-glutamyl-phosphate reductase [Bacillota bacterium]HPO97193.1 N-acetyl-gamma-glutamyl-phosphate reductase [Bacillota bacterium]